MNLDEMATAATAELHRAATRTMDPDDMLRRMHRSHRRRTGAWVAIVVLALALASTVALAQRTRSDLPPADRHTTSRTEHTSGVCHQAGITCLGDRRLRIATPTTTTLKVTVPRTFKLEPTIVPRGIEFYRQDVDTTGVTVIEDAIPVRYARELHRDPAAGTTAAAMARWLAHRPFLRDTRVTTSRVGGRTSWYVQGSLRPQAALPVTKNSALMVAPTFVNGPFIAGSAPDLPGEFTLIDQSGGGVTVIWSWTFQGNPSLLTGNRAMVYAILTG